MVNKQKFSNNPKDIKKKNLRKVGHYQELNIDSLIATSISQGYENAVDILKV